jgi:hypothetical protein
MKDVLKSFGNKQEKKERDFMCVKREREKV